MGHRDTSFQPSPAFISALALRPGTFGVLCEGCIAIVYQSRLGLLTTLGKKDDYAKLKLNITLYTIFWPLVVNNPDERWRF